MLKSISLRMKFSRPLSLPMTDCIPDRCWDGKNVDTPNHKDHVRYAIGASFGNFGQGCPSTHPVQLPLLFLETYWDTTAFDSEWTEGNSKQPFVWAMGDP